MIKLLNQNQNDGGLELSENWVRKESPSHLLLSPEEEILTALESLKKDQNKQSQLICYGFINLQTQNDQLLSENQKLTAQYEQLNNNFEKVVAELERLKDEREEKQRRKEARSKRKRLPKRAPMTAEIYHQLIKSVEGRTYLKIRLRIAFSLLVVTGIRVSELLPIKVSQLKTLVKDGWIAIDRSKRGPSSHKAFLTKEGRKILQNRASDFDYIFFMKDSDAYVFSSEKDDSVPIRRETLTKAINRVMTSVSLELPNAPNISSHSFRIGYITQLWRDLKDIEFVRQSIGHQKLETTSSYVTQLSDDERQHKINQIT
jgi:integrase